MADFSLQDLWWLKPKEQDNPLPALQLGVQIVQQKARMDLAERDLANDIARTSLMREETMAKQKIQTMLVAGNSEMATAISEVNDWTDEEQVSKVWAAGARNPMTVGGKAWLGAQHMHESARTAKRLEEEAQSRIAQRTSKTDLDFLKEERARLLADSTIDLNDAKIKDIDQDIAFAERKQKVQEGNLALRDQEVKQKGQKLSIRQQRMYDNELKALNNEETATLKSATGDESKRLRMGYNLRRRELTSKYYPDAEPAAAAPAATPQTVAPENNPKAAEIRESFKQGKITKEQAAQQLRELGFK